MTVYVDEPVDYGPALRGRGLRHTVWAHMTADTREELHAFADRLGLRRAWFQDHPVRWHYDITAPKHTAALRLGARQITRRELGAILTARRTAGTPAPTPPEEQRDATHRTT